MSRRARVFHKDSTPDPKFQNVAVARLINHLMTRGKKNASRTVVYDAFEIIAEKSKKDPLEVFDQAVANVGPSLEVKGRRIGGANYQIPYEVKGGRKETLAHRWLIEAARSRRGQPMGEALAAEMMEAAQNQGAAVKKREDIHKMAEANRAFAHFARH